MPLMREIWTPLKWMGIHYYKDENGFYYRKAGNNHRKKVRPFWKMKRIILGVPLLILLGLGLIGGYRISMNIASEKMMNEITSQISKEDIHHLLQDENVQEMIEKELGPEKAKKLLGKQIENNPLNKETPNNEVNKSSDASKETSSNVAQKEKGQPINGQQKAMVQKEKKQLTNIDQKEKKQLTNNEQLMFRSREEAIKFLLSKFSMSELTEFARMAEGGLTPEEKAKIKEAITKRLTPEEYNALKVYAFIELSKRNGQ
ncbi:hypothetical protein C0971_16775 [Bacillus methanolicus]|uniref:hypothetical protein n=1 Tax=Bacillus methanolicus TaxID=1471 RepID=UPI00200C3546|nr:hypothetical protein [Bacillus methanolicus]UQD53489.1 hypothetical protein C0971_16775 [Bacillus methanolicus]